MATSDLLHNGRLASWEFVRLISTFDPSIQHPVNCAPLYTAPSHLYPLVYRTKSLTITFYSQ
jgi:hypothetical protein